MSYIAVKTSPVTPLKYGTTDKIDSLQDNNTTLVYLKNTTRYSDCQIEEILEFSIPPGVVYFDATITKRFRDLFKGTCYPFGCRRHKVNPCKPLIIVRTSERDTDFPYWVERGDNSKKAKRTAKVQTYASLFGQYKAKRYGYISALLRSSQECLVYVVAHELRHLYQAKYKDGWVFGSKGRRSSERDADAYAIRKVRGWRRKNLINELDQAYHAASTFLSFMLQRITTVLSSILGNCRRSSIEQ